MSEGAVPARNQAADPSVVGQQLAEAIKKPPFGVLILAGAEDTGTNKRRFSFQVVNRQRYKAPGKYLVELWFGTVQYGAPAAGLTLTLISGTLHSTITANQHLKVITDVTGLVEIDAAIAGVSNRYAHAVLGGGAIEVAAASWV